ncbi:MAG: hypothetical protein KDA69_02825 [Planctomycetaceae bacterium]|nr:hypothetical protein [Planctomycetaceae bacterium]
MQFNTSQTVSLNHIPPQDKHLRVVTYCEQPLENFAGFISLAAFVVDIL